MGDQKTKLLQPEHMRRAAMDDEVAAKGRERGIDLLQILDDRRADLH